MRVFVDKVGIRLLFVVAILWYYQELFSPKSKRERETERGSALSNNPSVESTKSASCIALFIIVKTKSDWVSTINIKDDKNSSKAKTKQFKYGKFGN